MKTLRHVFEALHAVVAVVLVAVTLLLLWIAGFELWRTASSVLDADAAPRLIEVVGMVAIAILTLQIAQTLVEEEVVREAHISAPTRARRYLSRFLVVVVVSLSIEGLVATFTALHEASATLVEASALVFATAVLLAGWAAFIHLNRSAEELEPEAMEEAKSEDEKLR